MNIWDPIWKEEKEDSISDPVYKLKPIQINFNSVRLPINYYEMSRLLDQKVYFDIEFKEDYINTLDINKRKIWVLDDGGCVVKCELETSAINQQIVDAINSTISKAVQRKWSVTKITNGIRLSVDLPRRMLQPLCRARISSSYTYNWNFGQVKLLIPEPIRFDTSVVSIAARFEYAHMTMMTASGNKIELVETNVDHTMDINNYKTLNQLQLDSLSLVALHKFTIESSRNLISEIQDVISVPMPTRNYEIVENQHYPISYARIRSNNSIGSSVRPTGKCSNKGDPMPKIDQTQSKGRSLRSLGIVGKILSIIKRRKREIK